MLLVEDSENDAFLIEREIRRGGYDVEVTRVVTAEEMRGQLESCEWDLVISDYHLPGSSLEETLAACRADGRDIPFLLVSGTIGDEAAVKAMKVGANDYVLKGSLARLVPVIERELGEARLRKTAREADAELELARRQLLEETSSRARVFETLHRVAVGVAGTGRHAEGGRAHGRGGGDPRGSRRGHPPLVRRRERDAPPPRRDRRRGLGPAPGGGRGGDGRRTFLRGEATHQ